MWNVKCIIRWLTKETEMTFLQMDRVLAVLIKKESKVYNDMVIMGMLRDGFQFRRGGVEAVFINYHPCAPIHLN